MMNTHAKDLSECQALMLIKTLPTAGRSFEEELNKFLADAIQLHLYSRLSDANEKIRRRNDHEPSEGRAGDRESPSCAGDGMPACSNGERILW